MVFKTNKRASKAVKCRWLDLPLFYILLIHKYIKYNKFIYYLKT